MSGKTTVIGAISCKGNVVCQIIENADAKTLNRFVRKAVSDRVSLVATDEYQGYRYLPAFGFKHDLLGSATRVLRQRDRASEASHSHVDVREPSRF
jgi:hypothetical protein